MISDKQWSPLDPEVLIDPAVAHQHLLRQCPVHRCETFDPPFYTLSRYEDVEAALRDIETFSSQYGQGPRFTEPQGMLCDPPQHTFFRSLLQKWFTPGAINALTPSVAELANQLLDQALIKDNGFDLHDDFAFPLPVIIIARMLGVPEQDLDTFKHWSDVQVAAMGAEDPRQYAAEQSEFQNYMRHRLRERRDELASRQAAPDDLLSLVAGARYPDDDLAPETDALSVLTQLLVGGNETTTSLITNMIWRLLEQPQLWQELLTDRSLIDAAVEESLRYDPPVLGLYRNTTRDITLHGTTIPAGSKVLINYAAANRDALIFPDPDRFDLHRDRKRHMSFGLGVHMCIGAPMARLEAQIALQVLLERTPALQLAGPSERIGPFFLWGRRHLPVAGQAASSGSAGPATPSNA